MLRKLKAAPCIITCTQYNFVLIISALLILCLISCFLKKFPQQMLKVSSEHFLVLFWAEWRRRFRAGKTVFSSSCPFRVQILPPFYVDSLLGAKCFCPIPLVTEAMLYFYTDTATCS